MSALDFIDGASTTELEQLAKDRAAAAELERKAKVTNATALGLSTKGLAYLLGRGGRGINLII